ncbi:MAG: fibronectin type III domain-containing protein, partial [Acidobacteria bacterium]|nr:fibronectin type III domain-containing protein [Acidobacteriota bacterium]
AVSTADVESTRSNMLTVATTIPKPGIPGNLRCTGSYNNWADLEWDPSATPYGIVIDYYRIYEVEQTPFGPAYYTLGYSDFTYYRVNDWDETSKTYVVRAYDTSGNWSEYSAQLQVTENIADTTPPPVPSNLAGVPTGPFGVELTWNPVTDSGSGLKEYDIYRGGVFIASTTLNTYVDGDLTPETPYSYTVRAVDNAGNTSAPTSVVQVTTPVNDTQAPPAPAGLSGVALSDSQVQLSWSAVTDSGGSGLAGYEIFRDQNLIANTTSLSFTDGNLQPETLYTYAVRAYDNAGNRSGYSNIVEITTRVQDLTAPPPPANLAATAQDYTTVLVTWDPVQDEQGGSGLAGYQLYRNNQLLVTVETPSFTDTGLEEMTPYSYKVTAFDQASNVSGFSNTAEVTTPPFDQTPPPAPPDLTATALDDTRIHLEWTAVTDELGGSGLAEYRIFRDDQLIATVTTNAYTDLFLQPVTSYRYMVKARDNAGNDSSPSTEVTESTFALPLVSAQVASNDNWWTQFSIINIGPDDNPVHFNAYAADGTWLEEVRMESFPAGASYDGEAAAIFSPATLAQDFWVRVVSKSSLRGVLAFGTPDGETFVTIPMFARGSMDLYFPYVVFVEELWYTGISLINPHMEPVEVTLQAIDEDGYDLTSTVVNIPAGGKYIRLLEFLFPAVDPTTVRFIKVESPQPLFGFELFGNSQDNGLSGLPAFSMTTDLFGDPLAMSKAVKSGEKVRPSIPTGFHGVPLSDSQIYLEWNPNPEPGISYVIWDKTLGFEYDIATTTETHYTVSGLQPNSLYAYYLKAKNTGGESSSQTPTLTIQTLAEGQTNYPYQLMYSEIPDPDLYFTGITFSNMGTLATEVYLELYDATGLSMVDPLSVHVLSRQQMTRPLRYFFTDELLADAAYLKVGAMEPLLGFELFMAGGGSTGLPYQYDGIVGQEYGAPTLYFPLVKIAPDEFSSATWDSFLSVTDLSRRENNVAIYAFGADGSQLDVYTDLLAPQSKASWSVGEIFADVAAEIAWIKVAADGEIIGHMIYLDSFGARMSAYTGIRGSE